MNFRWFQLYVAFRNIFKRSNAIFWMYSRIRCLLDNLKYFVLRLYFYIKPQKKGLVRKKRLLKKRCIKMVRKSSSRQIHVFWLGNDHDQDFSGFMQAIKKLFQVSCYYDDDSYGQDWNQHYLDIRTKKKQSEKILRSVLSAHEKNKIDVLLMQTWGFKVCKKTIRDIKTKTGCIVINIGMDDKHSFLGKLYIPDNGTYGLRSVIDYHLTASTEAREWFRKLGVPCDYFPEASSKEIFYPLNIHKKYQVGLIGGAYGIRTKIHDKLCESGVSVTAYGFGWPQGRLDNDKVNEFYNSCEIVLGISGIGHCLKFCSLKLRDFDVPLSGSFYLTSSCRDLLSEYVVGKEIESYNSINELIEKTHYYLENNIERELIARRGYRRALNCHTYEIRIEYLIQKLVAGIL